MRLSLFVKSLLAAALASALSLPATARAQEADQVVAFVVARENPTSELSTDELRSMLLGKRRAWSDGSRVLPIDLERGPERDAVNTRVLAMSRSDVERWWVEQRIRGSGAAPRVAGSPSAVLKLVSRLRGAIGYVPLSEVDDTVKVLRIDGVAPGVRGYPVVAK
jgi:ABC-type phosphate transport system substrate-binding protein